MSVMDVNKDDVSDFIGTNNQPLMATFKEFFQDIVGQSD